MDEHATTPVVVQAYVPTSPATSSTYLYILQTQTLFFHPQPSLFSSLTTYTLYKVNLAPTSKVMCFSTLTAYIPRKLAHVFARTNMSTEAAAIGSSTNPQDYGTIQDVDGYMPPGAMDHQLPKPGSPSSASRKASQAEDSQALSQEEDHETGLVTDTVALESEDDTTRMHELAGSTMYVPQSGSAGQLVTGDDTSLSKAVDSRGTASQGGSALGSTTSPSSDCEQRVVKSGENGELADERTHEYADESTDKHSDECTLAHTDVAGDGHGAAIEVQRDNDNTTPINSDTDSDGGVPLPRDDYFSM
ncbi:uncharacterized protein BKCO1_11300012 [Diplodia corticola]|uniref:Uncharacterized protein n=1 Tax=Diplodia corticola TaxID=236234 RepID=A0A1J9R8N9_9PEZI|nr:uncharacterized protein BKCO1_11300012 [Diplodia corticola]OJD28771.1 hypothetical protein BKCO1_11300012 [Diplodia corticola]